MAACLGGGQLEAHLRIGQQLGEGIGRGGVAEQAAATAAPLYWYYILDGYPTCFAKDC